MSTNAPPATSIDNEYHINGTELSTSSAGSQRVSPIPSVCTVDYKCFTFVSPKVVCVQFSTKTFFLVFFVQQLTVCLDAILGHETVLKQPRNRQNAKAFYIQNLISQSKSF